MLLRIGRAIVIGGRGRGRQGCGGGREDTTNGQPITENGGQTANCPFSVHSHGREASVTTLRKGLARALEGVVISQIDAEGRFARERGCCRRAVTT